MQSLLASQKKIAEGTSAYPKAILPDTHNSVPRERLPIASDDLSSSSPFGVKILAEGVDPVIDIVAVHGLNGHRDKSWTTESGVLWLQDLLPIELPQARILTYGYDSRTHSLDALTKLTLYDHAIQLTSELYTYRYKTESHRRPIIFIAHSLGGIVVKSALIHSELAEKGSCRHLNSIKTSTHGILFFGTPHQGGNGVPWAKILLRDSEWLNMQLNQFNSISKDFETTFFFEMYPTPLPVGSAVIVGRESATVLGTSDGEIIGLRKHHRSMIRFNSLDDQDYNAVATRLVLMANKAEVNIAKRWETSERMQSALDGRLQDDFGVVFNMLHRRNHVFTGRKAFLHQLHSVLKPATDTDHLNAAIIHGTGGMGKTQIAIEYAYAQSDSYSAILWVNAHQLQSIYVSFLDAAQSLVDHYARTFQSSSPDYLVISQSLGLTGLVDRHGRLRAGRNDILGDGESSDPETTTRMVNAVHKWLMRQQNDKWLMIFDNVDDLESFDVSKFFPKSKSGSLLITSRRPECARYGLGLPLGHMDEPEAVMLLIRGSTGRIDENDNLSHLEARKIVSRLGYLPLAIEQASAYLARTSKSLESYLPLFESNLKALMSKRPALATWQYRDETVFTTWEISYTSAEKESLEATRILRITSFLSPEYISDHILVQGLKSTDFAISDLVATLSSFSLVNRTVDSEGLSFHPLVHDWARERLSSDQKHESLVEAFNLLAIVADSIDVKVRSHWATRNTLMPHIEQCYAWAKQLIFTKPPQLDAELASSCYSLGRMFDLCARHDEAFYLFQLSLEAQEIILGNEHVDLLRTLTSMADVLGKQAKFSLALEYYQRAFHGYTATLGENHSTTLATASNIAWIYVRQGNYDRALSSLKETLEKQETILGRKDLSTLSTMQSVANVYARQGIFEQALELYSDAAEALEEICGWSHPATLQCLTRVARCYSGQGNHQDALGLLFEALSGMKNVMGLEDDRTLDVTFDIGVVYVAIHEYDTALKFYRRTLEGREKLLGRSDAITLEVVGDIGSCFNKMGHFEEAQKWYDRTLAGRQEVLGLYHNDTLNTLGNCADNARSMGLYEQARSLYLKLLAARENVLGASHGDTLEVLCDLGYILRLEKNYSEAIKIYERALREYERTLGKTAELTLDVAVEIGGIYYEQLSYELALSIYTQALAGFEETLGSYHASTLDLIGRIGDVHNSECRYDLALLYYTRQDEGYRKSKSKDHLWLASTYIRKGNIYWNQQNYRASLEEWDLAFAIFEQSPERDSGLFRSLLGDIGRVVVKLAELDTGVQYCIRFVQAGSLPTESAAIIAVKEVMQMISKAILCGGDDELAAIGYGTFCLETSSNDTSVDNIRHLAICNSCYLTGSMEYIQGVRYVCKVCQDTDLCGDCFVSYQKKELAIEDCSSHSFLQIPQETWFILSADTMISELKQWEYQLQEFQRRLHMSQGQDLRFEV